MHIIQKNIDKFKCQNNLGERKVFGLIFKTLFYSEKKYVFSDEEIIAYDSLLQKTNEELISYDCIYPKYRFISYLIQKFAYIAHGTNRLDIDEFKPLKQTLYNGKIVEAVFGTKDSIWPVFFAIIDRSKVTKSIRNACIVTKNRRYYFFSLPGDLDDISPWKEGMIYFLPAKNFVSPPKGLMKFDEWISYEPVKPKLKLPVKKEDFKYLEQVTRHKPSEPVFKSWLLYKARLKKK